MKRETGEMRFFRDAVIVMLFLCVLAMLAIHLRKVEGDRRDLVACRDSLRFERSARVLADSVAAYESSEASRWFLNWMNTR